MGTFILFLRILLYGNEEKQPTKDYKMRQIGDKFHFKGYVWEIADRYQNGYALQRKTKNSLYEHNGWVTENYGVFDTDENKPEQIKRPRFNHCEHCNKFWEGSHYCKVRNSPERLKQRRK